MKAKSMKLRFLVTLHAIMKYSDENHRMNSIKLNEYLKPYGLDCTNRVLSDSIRIMREFGIDVQSKGEWDNQGIWIKNRPLKSDALNALIFAVTTNPYISSNESERILNELTPFVTLYQEPLLKSCVDKSLNNETMTEMEKKMCEDIYTKYRIICEAIGTSRRLRYQIATFSYNPELKTLDVNKEWPTLFTPKCIYQYQNKLYMIGYNHTDKKTDAVDLNLICDLKIAFKHKDPKAHETQEILQSIDPVKCIKEKIHSFLYEGEITFKCRGQYIGELYRMFGSPIDPVIKDSRCKCTYTVNGKLDTDKLNYIAGIKENNIRIIGPEKLVDAIHRHYNSTSRILTNPVIKSKKDWPKG